MRFRYIAAISLIAAASTGEKAQAQGLVYGGSGGTANDAQLILNGITTIPTLLRGWCFEASDASVYCNGRTATNNYVIGDPVNSNSDYRNWFSFGVPLDYGPILSASLRVKTANVEGGPHVVTFYDILNTTALGTRSAFSYADQGSGVVYGSRVYTEADDNMVWDIQLNSSAIASIFAAEGSVWATGGDMNANVAVVPEPGSMALLATGILGLLAVRRRFTL